MTEQRGEIREEKFTIGAGVGALLAVSIPAMRRAEQSCLTESLSGGSQPSSVPRGACAWLGSVHMSCHRATPAPVLLIDNLAHTSDSAQSSLCLWADNQRNPSTCLTYLLEGT